MDSPSWPFGCSAGDREIRLYYYRHRIYSAHLGRFCSRDPIGYGGGPSLFNYVANNPVNRGDATGQAWTSWVDWVLHYYFGNGETIDLERVGLLDRWRNSVSDDIARAKQQINDLVLNSCACQEEGESSKVVSGRIDRPYSTTGDLYSDVGPMGNGIFHITYRCTVKWTCECCESGELRLVKATGSCTYNWAVRDEFTNPTDEGGMNQRSDIAGYQRCMQRARTDLRRCRQRIGGTPMTDAICNGRFRLAEHRCRSRFLTHDLPFATPYYITASWADTGAIEFRQPCE